MLTFPQKDAPSRVFCLPRILQLWGERPPFPESMHPLGWFIGAHTLWGGWEWAASGCIVDLSGEQARCLSPCWCHLGAWLWWFLNRWVMDS